MYLKQNTRVNAALIYCIWWKNIRVNATLIYCIWIQPLNFFLVQEFHFIYEKGYIYCILKYV